MPHEFLAADERVVSFGTYAGTFRSTGKSMAATFAHRWVVRGGKIVRFNMYTDTAKVLEAMRGCKRLPLQDGYAGAVGEATMTTQSKFYCNTTALSPAERVRHTKLTEKLISGCREIVEMEKGYAFQYDPSNVSLAELTDWVVAESKCCPFFDFCVGLERAGSVLCLQLTGAAGVKPFILLEFQILGKSEGER